MADFNNLFAVLAELKIKFVKYEHTPFFTCEDSLEWAKTAPGAHTKNLFLENEEKTACYLLTLMEGKRASLNALRRLLGEKGLHFGPPDKLKQLLGVLPGSVSPLGLIYDTGKKLPYLIDANVWQAESLNVHPNINTATLNIGLPDFKKFLDWWGGKVGVYDSGNNVIIWQNGT